MRSKAYGEAVMIERDSIIKLTREEIIAQLDAEARRRRGVSAAALLRAYRDGALENPGDVADLLAFARLLPEDDPLFAST